MWVRARGGPHSSRSLRSPNSSGCSRPGRLAGSQVDPFGRLLGTSWGAVVRWSSRPVNLDKVCHPPQHARVRDEEDVVQSRVTWCRPVEALPLESGRQPLQ